MTVTDHTTSGERQITDIVQL